MNMIMLGLNRWNMNKFLFVCGTRSEKGGHMLMLKIRKFNEDEGKFKNNFKNGDFFYQPGIISSWRDMLDLS